MDGNKDLAVLAFNIVRKLETFKLNHLQREDNRIAVLNTESSYEHECDIRSRSSNDGNNMDFSVSDTILKELLQKENKELRNKCEKLMVQMRLRDTQYQSLQLKFKKLEELLTETSTSSANRNDSENATDLALARLHAEAEMCKDIVGKIQGNHDLLIKDTSILKQEYNRSIDKIAKLTSHLTEANKNVERLSYNDAELTKQLNDQLAAVVDQRAKLESFSLIEGNLKRSNQVLQDQNRIVKDKLSSERNISAKLVKAVAAAEETSSMSLEGVKSAALAQKKINANHNCVVSELRAVIATLEKQLKNSTNVIRDSSSNDVNFGERNTTREPVDVKYGSFGGGFFTNDSKSNNNSPTQDDSSDFVTVENQASVYYDMTSPSKKQKTSTTVTPLIAVPSNPTVTTTLTTNTATTTSTTTTTNETKVLHKLNGVSMMLPPTRTVITSKGFCLVCKEAAYGLMVKCKACCAEHHSVCARKSTAKYQKKQQTATATNNKDSSSSYSSNDGTFLCVECRDVVL